MLTEKKEKMYKEILFSCGHRFFMKNESFEKEVRNCNCYGCNQAIYHKSDIINHGLNAFNECDFDEVFTRLDNLYRHPEWEVCCTGEHRFCGPIGIMGTGDIVSYYPVDVYSTISKYANGYRIIGDTGIKKLKEFFNTKVSKHEEYFVKRIRPICIWVKKDWFNSLTEIEKLKIIKKAKELQLKILIVKNEIVSKEHDNTRKHVNELFGIINGNKIIPINVFKNNEMVEYLTGDILCSRNLKVKIKKNQIESIFAEMCFKKGKRGYIEYKDMFSCIDKVVVNVSHDTKKEIVNIMVENKYLRFYNNRGFTVFFVNKITQ